MSEIDDISVQNTEKLSDTVKQRQEFLLYDIHLAAYFLDPKQKGKVLTENQLTSAGMKLIFNLSKAAKQNVDKVLQDMITGKSVNSSDGAHL